jgi:hypothetical protein
MEPFKKFSLLKETESVTSYNTTMETIKIIDEKTIERNGIKYVPEKAEEPKFKVGQWVVFLPEKAKDMHLYTDFWNAPHIMRILKITNADNYLHFDENQDPYNNGDKSSNVCDCFRPATKEEIEAHLRKICDEKYIGKKARSLCSNTENKVTKFYKYFEYNDSLQYYTENETWNSVVYEQGEFAEIIPDKKPKPVTRKDFEEFLAAYEGNYFNGFAMSSFLNDYLF